MTPSCLPPGAVHPGEIGEYVAAGGRRLAFRLFRAASERRHVVYLHGIESHGGWFVPAALRLAEQGCTCWLLDRRGSGLNLAADPGDTRGFRVLLDDVRAFGDVCGQPFHLAGLSWGGKLAVACTLDDPRAVLSLALLTPGLVARVDLPLGRKFAVLASALVGGRRRFALPLEPSMFTTTQLFRDFIAEDPCRLREATGRFLLASRRLDAWIRRRIGDLDKDVLLLLAERDRIIDNTGVQALLAKSRARVDMRVFQDAEHALQFDHLDRVVEELVRSFERIEEQS